MKQEDKSKEKKVYQKPKIETEKILDAGLGGGGCNGSSTAGGRKAVDPPCTVGKLQT